MVNCLGSPARNLVWKRRGKRNCDQRKGERMMLVSSGTSWHCVERPVGKSEGSWEYPYFHVQVLLQGFLITGIKLLNS